MVENVGSSAGSYLADPTSPISSHCASIVMTSTLRVNKYPTVCWMMSTFTKVMNPSAHWSTLLQPDLQIYTDATQVGEFIVLYTDGSNPDT